MFILPLDICCSAESFEPAIYLFGWIPCTGFHCPLQSRYLLPSVPFISLHSFFMVGLLSELFYIGIPIRHGPRLFLPLYHSDSRWNHVSLQCSIVNSIKTASDSLFCCLFLCLKVCWSCSAKINRSSFQRVKRILK